MLVVPMLAAAGAAASGAQAADEMTNLDDTCLECAGIGIVPCEFGQGKRLQCFNANGVQAAPLRGSFGSCHIRQRAVAVGHGARMQPHQGWLR